MRRHTRSQEELTLILTSAGMRTDHGGGAQRLNEVLCSCGHRDGIFLLGDLGESGVLSKKPSLGGRGVLSKTFQL